jgi:hypothetical protein
MPRRRFRYDPATKEMVEIGVDPNEVFVSIHGEITPFVSVVDGSYIDSRSKLLEHMAKFNLVPYDEARTQKREEDRYQEARDTKELRERLWEGVSRTFSMGNRPRR